MVFSWSYVSKRNKLDITIDDTSEKIQDKVTDIMGPLSKLWVMIENTDSEKDGNAPVVQMDTVLGLTRENCSVNWTM